jgi:ATP-binding cassette subfamily C protein LapB
MTRDSSSQSSSGPLSSLIMQAARLVGQSMLHERIDLIEGVAAGAAKGASAATMVREAWLAAGLEGEPLPLPEPGPIDCPFIGRDATLGWFLVSGRNADGSWLVQPTDAEGTTIDTLDRVECTSLPARSEHRAPPPSAGHLIRQALWRRKTIFAEALLATVLVNFLALVASIYSMQVYDRVIPNHGFQTLWVLSAGALAALVFEFMLKQVRTHAIEKTATRIDSELSEWFFERALGIRLESRPPVVGTLAAQIKGFELVRGVMSASSIFMLVDVPFALFFIAIIAMVGGWLVAIPVLLLPVSLLAGLLFQHQIVRHSKENQGQGNRKAGLLVESIDGAESLKANSAEWKLQSRWSRLVAEAGESDYRIKQYASLSQNMTVSVQQAGYIALVAAGACLVAENHLTMGALIACTIINGRALTPIAQLPVFMVQYAHARAAMEGLDKLIGLPNEIDDRAHALVPQSVSGGIRLDQAVFSYGPEAETALDIARLEIRPGERIGIVGAIGSGKSTLLKVASGLYRPSKGKVFLGGIDMATMSAPFVRESVAYLPQEMRLVSGTLRDNLLQGLPDPGDEVLLQAARESGLISLVSNHPKGLALPITEGGRGISGGQKQLVGLTRILLANPKVLLLDEPSASMDSVAEARVIAMLRRKVAGGATLVVATHKNALFQLVDRLLVMQAGRVLLDGPRDGVLLKLAGGRGASITTLGTEGAAKASA